MSMDVLGMMQAREARAQRQAALLRAHQLPLICFTMNTPGPEKTNAQIVQAFLLSRQRLVDALKAQRLLVKHMESHLLKSGPEAFFCVQGEARDVKKLCVMLEERDALGRLLDLDVLNRDGSKLSRENKESRGCLVCGNPGSLCAVSRAHSVESLFKTAMQIIKTALTEEEAQAIAGLASQALLMELAVTPKPGLVDRNNTGAHEDMDVYTFMASVPALTPYFMDCARLGQELGQTEACFARLRLEGMLAEGQMLRATGGINTHKGAIFTLGILAAAAGHLIAQGLPTSPENLARAAASMSKEALERERKQLVNACTHGEALMTKGLSGARAEAALGFPSVMNTGLPALVLALQKGESMDQAGAKALLSMMLVAQDTVLLRRAGAKNLGTIFARVGEVLEGGAQEKELLELDGEFSAHKLSPGGSADLLAACFFVHLLQNRAKVHEINQGLII